jgi:O-antigen/teichoic acid export membrane protein
VRYVLGGTPVPESQNHSQMSTQVAERVGDVGGSIVAEAYHNFTVFGMLVLLLLCGLGLGWVNERARRGGAWLAAAGVSGYVFLLLVRNSFAQVPTVLVLTALATMCACLLAVGLGVLRRLVARRRAGKAAVPVMFGAVGIRSIVLALAFLTSLVTARSLGPDGRGLISLLLSLSVLASSLGGLSAELGFAHQFGKNSEDQSGILSGATYGSVAWGLMVGLITAAVAALVWTPPGDDTVVALVFLGCYTFLTVTTTWTQRALFLEGEPVRAAVVSLVESTITFGVVGVLAVTGGLTVGLALAAIAGGSAVGTVLSLVWTQGRPRYFRARQLAQALATGTRFHLGQIALQLLVRFDIVLLSAFAGLASVGIYSVAVSLTAPVGVFATTIGTTFLREQFSPEEDQARIATLRLVAVTTLLVVPSAALLLLVAVPLIPVVWGPDFAGARLPLLLLAPGVVAMAVQRAVGNYFVRLGRAWILNVRAVVAVVLNVSLCLALIPTWGANGAAIASTVAYVVYALISIRYWMQDARVGVGDMVRAFREVSFATAGRLLGHTA